ncbi:MULTISPECIES: hypothetical protein [unclassified Duganella]|uniref:hypothetical protein n=1 Tax=unclassified Duganella TaxID=2636909 RepID=UPI00131445F3
MRILLGLLRLPGVSLRLLFFCLLLGHMTANQATSHGPGNRMVSRNVANNRTCRRAFDAAGGRRAAADQHHSRQQQYKMFFHDISLGIWFDGDPFVIIVPFFASLFADPVLDF